MLSATPPAFQTPQRSQASAAASPMDNPFIKTPTPFTQAMSPSSNPFQTRTPSQASSSGSLPMPSPLSMSASSSYASPNSPLRPRNTEGSVARRRLSFSGSESDTQSASSAGSAMETDDDEELVQQYLSEMGTEEQLVHFFDNFAEHTGMSQKCALDGRYFWKVLAPYPGLVESEMYIRINQLGFVQSDAEGTMVREYRTSEVVFDPDELAKTRGINARYRLIKLIVDISNDPESNTGSVHSNLIYIDTEKEEVVRFEPMVTDYYTDVINDLLQDYFSKLLAGYSYRMLDEHPQLPATDSCPSKGMCAAYVLKKAMMLVTGQDQTLNRDPLVEEKSILHFADAIETEYGLLPDPENAEAGFSIGFSTGPPLPLLPYGSPYGVPYLDPYAPVITPMIRPGLPMYSPQFYGYVNSRRFARRPGWGWGLRRHRHWGKEGSTEDKGKLAAVREKLAKAADKAKAKLGIGKESAAQKDYAARVERTKKQLDQANWNRASDNIPAGDIKQSVQAPASPKEVVSAPNARAMAERIRAERTGAEARWRVVRREREAAEAASEARLEYGHRCGCMGCDMAHSRFAEYGYSYDRAHRRSEHGHGEHIHGPGCFIQQPGKAPSPMASRPVSQEGQYMGGQGEFGMVGGQEYGCGCMKDKSPKAATASGEYGIDPRTWTPGQQALGGAAVGALAGGLLTGSMGGALIGAGVGGVGGYALGQSSRNRQQQQYQQYRQYQPQPYGQYKKYGPPPYQQQGFF